LSLETGGDTLPGQAAAMLIRYAIRSLLARKGSIAPALLSVAGTVASTLVMLAMIGGLSQTLLQSGDPRNAVVLSAGAHLDFFSQLSQQSITMLKGMDGVSRTGEAVSAELRASLRLRRPDGRFEAVTIRGVEPIALALHGAQMVDGELPARGAPGVIVGGQWGDSFGQFTRNGKLRVGRENWPLVGRFRAPGTLFDSEVWCDRTALATALGRNDYSVATVRLESADALPRLSRAVERYRDQRMEALSERTYRKRSSEDLGSYVRAIYAVIVLLIAGSAFACANASYTAFLARLKEIATLLAIGFTRPHVAALLVFETVLVAVFGCLLGLVAIPLVDGRTIEYPAMSLFFVTRVTGLDVLASVGVAVVTGLAAGIGSVIQVVRLPLLEVLQDG
jgi:putative ABC transport system permease protein